MSWVQVFLWRNSRLFYPWLVRHRGRSGGCGLSCRLYFLMCCKRHLRAFRILRDSGLSLGLAGAQPSKRRQFCPLSKQFPWEACLRAGRAHQQVGWYLFAVQTHLCLHNCFWGFLPRVVAQQWLFGTQQVLAQRIKEQRRGRTNCPRAALTYLFFILF